MHTLNHPWSQKLCCKYMDLICNKTLLAQEVHPLKNFPVVLTLSCMKTLQLSLSRIHKIKQKTHKSWNILLQTPKSWNFVTCKSQTLLETHMKSWVLVLLDAEISMQLWSHFSMKKEVGFEHSTMFLSNDLHGICRLRLHSEAQQLQSLQSLPWAEKYPLRQCWTQGSPSWLSLEWELHHCHCVEPMPEQACSMCIPSLLQSPPLVPATLDFSPNSHPSILVESAPPRSHTHKHIPRSEQFHQKLHPNIPLVSNLIWFCSSIIYFCIFNMLRVGIFQIPDIINSQQKSTEKQALLSTCWRDN